MRAAFTFAIAACLVAAAASLARGGVPSRADQQAPRGDCFSFGASHIHDVQHAAGDPAASLHAYLPPLGEMGFYQLDDSGTLTRRPGDSDDEFPL